MLENQFNQSGTSRRKVRLMLFNVTWSQCSFVEWMFGVALPHLVHGMKQRKSQKCFLCIQLQVKSSTVYPIMLVLGIGAQPIEYYPCKEYIRISHKSRTCLIIDCPNKLGMQDVNYKKLIREKSSHLIWCLTLCNGFKRWGVNDLQELSSDAPMSYVIIRDKLLEAHRMKWQYAKMSKLEYYMANTNP